MNLDLNKACDRVNWIFIEEVLTAIGTPYSWIHLIIECMISVTYTILVNSEATRLIKPKVGLRQGDPLSPCFFILCMKVLSRKMLQQQRQGLIHGLKISCKALELSHLFFADDALFFMKITMDNVWILKKILENFCQYS